jgi:chromosomal replication initiator protein
MVYNQPVLSFIMMVWKRAKKKLQDVLSENIYTLWIEPLEVQQKDGTNLLLSCPDRYFAAYVSQNFLPLICEKVAEVDGEIARVCINETSCSAPRRPEPSQLRLPSVPKNNSSTRSLHPRYTFDDFMVGDSNILAQSACRSMSSLNDAIGPCLYINSSTGLGKTHLTHAIAHTILDESPSTRLHYLTAQQFASEMVQNIRTNGMNDFKQKYHSNCDILLVEDVQCLIGKKKTQQELNEVLDALIKSGKRVVFTANKSPRELAGIDDDIRSRMSSGLVTSIQKPDLATRARIIRRKAEQHNLVLQEAFVDYLAQHVKGDVRRIESAIIAVSARASLNNGQIDEKLVEEVVTFLVGTPRALSAHSICELVGRQFKVSLDDLQSRSRKKAIAFPRQVAMYLSRKHTEETLAEIGRAMNRDHSTVMHSIKVVSGLIRRDNSVSAQLDLLSNKVRQL